MKRTQMKRGVWSRKPKVYTVDFYPTTRAVTPKVARKPKKPTLTSLKKKLDAIFSIYIRNRDQGQCFTCPKKDDPKRMQNGHFVPRQYLAVRYDEKNCNCQCYACNMLYNGQPATYAIRLAKKYGQEVIEELESKRWEVTKLTPEWYEEKTLHYKKMVELQ